MDKQDADKALANSAAESIHTTTPGGYHPRTVGAWVELVSWGIAGATLVGFVALLGKCSHAAG